MALDKCDDGRLIQLCEATDRLDAGLLEEQPDRWPMANDRPADKPPLPSQIAGEVFEDPFACAQLDRFGGRDRAGLAQDRQKLVQRGPIAGLRTAVFSTPGQVGCGDLLISVVNAKVPALQPT